MPDKLAALIKRGKRLGMWPKTEKIGSGEDGEASEERCSRIGWPKMRRQSEIGKTVPGANPFLKKNCTPAAAAQSGGQARELVERHVGHGLVLPPSATLPAS